MKTKALTIVLGSIFFISLSSFTFNSNSDKAEALYDWVRLGSRKVNYKLDKDVIHVGLDDGRFKKLKVQVTGGRLNMHKMVVHYGNGSKENIELKHNFGKRSGSRVIDLNGNKRIIKKIVFLYDSKNNSRKRAMVHVFGKR